MKKIQTSGLRVRSIAMTLILAHLFMVGCATKSNSIPPAFVSGQAYEGKQCNELHDELREVNSSLTMLSAKQDSTASTDTTTFWVGMLLFWPVIFVPVFTGDDAAEISDLKGRQLALDNAVTNRCSNAARAEPDPVTSGSM